MQERNFDDAERIFRAMLDRGETSSATRNNYGAVILEKAFLTLSEGDQVRPQRIEEARKAIFKACNFDKKVSLSWSTAPAYRNLCFLRNIEARFRYSRGEFLGAFVVGWISIEMTLHRIWFQYLQKTCSGITDQQALYDRMMAWRVQTKLEVFSKAQIIDSKTKGKLSNLNGIRNRLIHGEINDPTKNQAKQCVDIGYDLIPLFNI